MTYLRLLYTIQTCGGEAESRSCVAATVTDHSLIYRSAYYTGVLGVGLNLLVFVYLALQ